jgi:hypothetical protein
MKFFFKNFGFRLYGAKNVSNRGGKEKEMSYA